MSFSDSPTYKAKSKERLKRIIKKKIQTTMIGAISSVENLFGFLWDEKAEDAEKMHELFQTLRSEILDKGNHQIRNVDTEIDLYDISLQTKTVTLPVKKIGGQNG